MKKLALLLAVLMFVLSFAACTDNSGSGRKDKDEDDDAVATTAPITTPAPTLPTYNYSAEVNTFVDYVTNGSYLDAVDHYNNAIYGNYNLESEATTALVNLLLQTQQGVLNGTVDKTTAEATLGVVTNVADNAGIYIDDMDNYTNSISEAIASKAAFQAAKDLEALRNYADAITQYALVIEGDSNYAAAQSAIANCKATLKQETFNQLAGLDYLTAIEKLQTLYALMPEDADVISKLTVYETTYISDAIARAEAAFVSPATDYEAALAIINAAIQHYPDNANLLAKRDYYQSFIPVDLYTMKALKGRAGSKYDATEDTYGNTHNNCFLVNEYWDTDITFHTDSNYNTFSFTYFGQDKSNYPYHGKIVIYGDGVQLFQKQNIPNNSTPPTTVTVDITGVSELRIFMECGGSWEEAMGMTDMFIQRTVK